MLRASLLCCWLCGVAVAGGSDSLIEELTRMDRQAELVLQSCEAQLVRLYEVGETHVFAGCRLKGIANLDLAIGAALDVLQCNHFTVSSNTSESFVQNYTLQTPSARKSLKVCIDGEDALSLFVVTVVQDKRDRSLVAYFERKRSVHQLIPDSQRERIHKVLPKINIRLVADFFYPFSCQGTTARPGWSIIPSLAVPLALLVGRF